MSAEPPVTPDSEKFARLRRPRRIWAVGAVHGAIEPLIAMHEVIGQRFEPGDRLVYLGNLIGRGPAIGDVIDEIIVFRREILALPGVIVGDIVYLRGAQEEMWQKLLQLQFAPNPGDVLHWMASQGVAETLATYGGRVADGFPASRDGAVALTRWTNGLREAIRRRPGHSNVYASLRRAAFTEDAGVLLVSAGIDLNRPLAAQGDSFWWASDGFARLDKPYEGFRRVVRGHDPDGGGVQIQEFAVTLDGGCGAGGELVVGLFDRFGEILDVVNV